MHDTRALTEARIRRFAAEHLVPNIAQETAPVTVTAHAVEGEPIPAADAIAADYAPLELPASWGRAWSTLWLHITGTVPDDWAGKDGSVPELVIDLGFDGEGVGFQAEGLVFTPDGRTVKAINPMNRYVPLAPGEQIDLYVECAANPDVAGSWFFQPTDLGDPETIPERDLYRIQQVELVRRDERIAALLEDIRALGGLMLSLPEDSPRRHEILRALEQACDVADPDDLPGTADAAREVLAPVLASGAGGSALDVIATGHAHIDSAWLWPVRETRRKCARTFSNVVALMDADPDATFSCSSAQQYQWIKEGYPELFERIREKVAEGRFEPVGGMWVESDTNMPGSEAMARQFVAGKRFFLDSFGVETTQTWLPDSFGYSAALPQITALAGQKDFLTQKVSWNQTNTFPHHTFWWEGLDGTKVFTHFPPADTYNGNLTGEELAYITKNFKEKGKAKVAIDLYGWGDGGGGPTREMIAAGRRAADLEGSPKVTFGTAAGFFERAREDYPDAPTWAGELYLELHRGTYSAQLATKQGNRRSEHLLHEAEFLASLAAIRADGYAYPYDELEAIWRDALLNQFHDILPGSSIAWVHRDAERSHAGIARRAEQIIADALAALGGTGEASRGDGAGDEGSADPGAGGAGALVNTAPVARRGVPAYAAGPVAADEQAATARREDGEIVLDNEHVRAVIDGSGNLVSLRGADGREAIAPGARGALLQLHRDNPNAWDAWDIDEFYRHVVRDLDAPVEGPEIEQAEDGSARVRVTYATRAAEGEETRGLTAGPSRITQTYVLRPGEDSLEIDHDVDWHEHKKALKLAFPLDLRAAHMSSEIQFGHIDRPIPVNTSWDAARFETCAHRWVHVAEGDHGVAIANDSTYGHDVLRTVREDDGGTTTTARLTLVRSPEYPDPRADEGQYRLRVAIRPDASIHDAIEEGYRLNLPERDLDAAGAAALAAAGPLVEIDAPSVLVETVKLAEDRSGDLVLRLYESEGARASAHVCLAEGAGDVAAATAVDLLERPFGDDEPAFRSAIAADADGIDLDFRPFEIKTVRIPRS